MKKKIFMIIEIVIIFIVMRSGYFYYNSDKVTVNKDDGSSGMILNIKNHIIEDCATLKFACSEYLENMAKIITEQGYTFIYGKTDESLYIFADGIYKLDVYEGESNIFINRYIYGITQATVSVDAEQISNDAHIPFPYGEVISIGTLMDDKMEIKCGFKYLKEFYENVETATVYDDMIDIDVIIYDYDEKGNDIERTDKYVRIKYEGDNVISFEVLNKE